MNKRNSQVVNPIIGTLLVLLFNATIVFGQLKDSTYTRLYFRYTYQPNGTPSFLAGTQAGTGVLSGRKNNPNINFNNCGFLFSADSTVGLLADMYFYCDTDYVNTLWANNGYGGIHDLGKIDFDTLVSLPSKSTQGFYNSQHTSAIVNHVYGVVTRDTTHYAKFHLTKIDTVITFSPTFISVTSQSVPSDFDLQQNYPNPFNSTTMIKYQLPVDCFVDLEVFDILGRHVATLLDARQKLGYHEVRFDGAGLGSGIYLYRLQTEHYITSKSLLLLK